MKHFVAIVHHDEGSAYGLTFPDVPGCFAASDDLDGIVAAGAEALGLFFDDVNDVPEPRDLDALRDEIRTAILDGAVSSVVVPYVGRSGRVERVNISLDTAVLAAIDREAGSRKLTRSAFLTVAATSEIEHRPAVRPGASRASKIAKTGTTPLSAAKVGKITKVAAMAHSKGMAKGYSRKAAKTGIPGKTKT